jgi:hypothetical protein
MCVFANFKLLSFINDFFKCAIKLKAMNKSVNISPISFQIYDSNGQTYLFDLDCNLVSVYLNFFVFSIIDVTATNARVKSLSNGRSI